MAQPLGDIIIRIVGNSSHAVAQLVRVSQTVTSVGHAVRSIGTDMALFGASILTGVIIPLRGATEEAMKFQNTMRLAQVAAGATAGAGLSAFNEVSKNIEEMSLRLSVLPQIAANAQRELGTAGIAADQMGIYFKNAADAAASTGGEVDQWIKLLIQGVNAFQDSISGGKDAAKNVQAVADLFVKAANAGLVKTEDFQFFMQTAGGNVNLFSQDATKAIAVFTTMQQVMGNGARAAVALSQAMSRVANAASNLETKEGRKLAAELAEIGLTAEDITPSITNSIEQIFEKIDKLGLTAKQINKIFGEEGKRAFGLFIKLHDDYNRILKDINEGESAAGTAAKVRETQTFQVQQLIASYQWLRKTIGELVVGELAKYSNWLIGAIGKIKTWIIDNGELAGSILKVVVAIGGIATIGGVAVIFLGQFIAALGRLGVTGGALYAIFSKVLTLPLTMASSIYSVIGGIISGCGAILTSLFSINGLLRVIRVTLLSFASLGLFALLALGIALVYANLENLKLMWDGFVEGFMTGFYREIIPAWNEFKAALVEIAKEFGLSSASADDFFNTVLIPAAKEAGLALAAFIAWLLKISTSFIKWADDINLVSRTLNALIAVWDLLKIAVLSVSIVTLGFIRFSIVAVQNLGLTWQLFWNKFKMWGMEAIAFIGDKLGDFLIGLGKLTGIDFFQDWGQLTKDGADELRDQIKELEKSLITSKEQFAQKLDENFLTPYIDSLATDTNSAIDDLKLRVKNIIDGTENFKALDLLYGPPAPTGIETTTEATDDLATAAADAQAELNGMRQAAIKAATDMGDSFDKVVKGIKEAMKDYVKSLTTARLLLSEESVRKNIRKADSFEDVSPKAQFGIVNIENQAKEVGASVKKTLTDALSLPGLSTDMRERIESVLAVAEAQSKRFGNIRKELIGKSGSEQAKVLQEALDFALQMEKLIKPITNEVADLKVPAMQKVLDESKPGINEAQSTIDAANRKLEQDSILLTVAEETAKINTRKEELKEFFTPIIDQWKTNLTEFKNWWDIWSQSVLNKFNLGGGMEGGFDNINLPGIIPDIGALVGGSAGGVQSVAQNSPEQKANEINDNRQLTMNVNNNVDIDKVVAAVERHFRDLNKGLV